MEYFTGASDQTIFESGLSRAGYARALTSQTRTRRLEDQRQANTTPGQERNGSRFYEGGTPVTKLKAWQEQQRADAPIEQTARELYQRIMLHKRAGIPVNFDMAEWANLLGFTQETVRQSLDYFNSPECAKRFGTSAE